MSLYFFLTFHFLRLFLFFISSFTSFLFLSRTVLDEGIKSVTRAFVKKEKAVSIYKAISAIVLCKEMAGDSGHWDGLGGHRGPTLIVSERGGHCEAAVAGCSSDNRKSYPGHSRPADLHYKWDIDALITWVVRGG